MTQIGTPPAATQYWTDYGRRKAEEEAIPYLKDVSNKLAEVILKLRREHFATAGEKFLNADGLKARREATMQRAMLAIDVIQEAADKARATIQDMTDAALVGPQDTNERLLDVQMGEQAWRRISQQLADGADMLDLIQRAVSNSDLATLRTIKNEIPFLKSNPDLTSAYLKVIDDAVIPLLPDAQHAAMIRQKEVDANWPTAVVQAIAWARHEASGEGSGVSTLPAWGGGVVRF